MCTLIVSVGQWPSCPLLVASNRDESLRRPATGPRWWPGEPFFAPRDEQAGGSWLGLTRSGMFVGLTNRFQSKNDPSRESRGNIVLEALRHDSPASLHRALSVLSPTRFNPFHLLYSDGLETHVTWVDDEKLHQQTLGAGLHIVTERSLGGDDRARTSLIRDHWREVSPNNALPSVEALKGLLSLTRPDDPVGGVCVEVPGFDYGTRSSFLFFKSEKPQVFSADGRPDRSHFDDLSAAYSGGQRPL